jgi:hypothetical protein
MGWSKTTFPHRYELCCVTVSSISSAWRFTRCTSSPLFLADNSASKIAESPILKHQPGEWDLAGRTDSTDTISSHLTTQTAESGDLTLSR